LLGQYANPSSPEESDLRKTHHVIRSTLTKEQFWLFRAAYRIAKFQVLLTNKTVGAGWLRR